VLSGIPTQTDPRVLVDFRTADDAGVFAWEGGPALVQTVDFFTPIVDDPYLYGQIAAANAISDVYAMGGRPLTALAIAGFPDQGLDDETIRQIFLGGFDQLRTAGVALLGGHTVRDKEIKFGYAVTGAVDPTRIWTNTGARPGDVVFLTKPLGTGIVGTAIKNARAPEPLVAKAVEAMRTLNKAAADAVADLPVHACTDITGFGLIGHASEMAVGSGVTIDIDSATVPLLDGVLPLVAANRSGGLASNREHFGPGVERAVVVSDALMDLFFDPQTSGGLFVAVPESVAPVAASRLPLGSVAVGRVGPASAHAVRIR
jgi:selenide,water dikinase